MRSGARSKVSTPFCQFSRWELLGSSFGPGPATMYEYRASVERVVDGDTIDLSIDLGFDVWIRQRVRLSGIDTPETRTKDPREKKYGLLAKARVEGLLPPGSAHDIATTLDDRGKYGRVLADVMVDVFDKDRDFFTTVSLCYLLVEEHLAVYYSGGNRAALRAAHTANWDYLEKRGKENG